MKSWFKLSWCLVALMTVMVSCSDDSDDDVTPEYSSLEGVFVVGEGSMNYNNGAISFYNDEQSESDIFKEVNGRGLGDVVNDFEIVDTLGFVVVNNSQKVEVVRMRDFKSVTTLDDEELTYPRFAKQATESTVYISNGMYEGEVLVYNFKTFELEASITVGKGPEMMEKLGDYMYVANSGGYDVDQTISVIDIASSAVVKTIDVAEVPITMKLDKDNNLWVYCKGPSVNWTYSSPKLYKINTSTNSVEKEFSINKSLSTYGNNLLATSLDGYVYYYADATYKLAIDADELPTESWLDNTYYGIEVNPTTGSVFCLDGSNNEVIVLDADDASEINRITETAPYPHSVIFNN